MKRLLLLASILAISIPAVAYATTPSEQRSAIQSMESNTLTRVYKAQPDTQREIQNAVGYAVFTNGSMAIIWVSGGYGHGVAHDNQKGSDTYMQMASAGVGLGLGAKDYNMVFVFHDAKAFHNFTTTGLDLSGGADATAKVGAKGGGVGGAADVLPGVRIYQLTKTGVIAQAMVQGTKYWRDDELN